MHSINPATGDVLAHHTVDSAAELERKIAQAQSRFDSWKELPIADRADKMRMLADVLSRDSEHHARVIVEEMGKPVAQAVAEVKKCAWVLRHYADEAPRILATQERDLGTSRGLVRYDPLGVLFAIMPWNYPFWQVFRFAAPAMAAGNTILVKHAPNTWGSMLAIEGACRKADLPEGLLTGLYVDIPVVEEVINDPRVCGVTLTGSERAGTAVAAQAGRALKKCVLELGGSDAAIVLEDADIEHAVTGVLNARMSNSGQACCNAKRIIVLKGVADAFIERFTEAVRSLKVGAPLSDGVDVGPMAREDLRGALVEQIRRSVEQGARVVVGCEPLKGPGYFMQPGILTDIPPDSPAAKEELFGPVAALFVVDSIDEAVVLANDSDYGLCASIWTTKPAEAAPLAARLHVGGVFINSVPTSDPRIPFGGIKKSGFGRELGEVGLLEFVNAKSVCIGL